MRNLRFLGRSCLLALALGLAPAHSLGAPAEVHHIGALVPPSPPIQDGLRQGLNALGYEEGRNLSIEWRVADGNTDNARTFAEELARKNLDLIVTAGSDLSRHAVNATKQTPIVFMVGDPIGTGLVENLGRPGGNATGISVLTTDLAAKRVELLHKLAPRAKRILQFTNPSNPASLPARNEIRQACERLGIAVTVVAVRNADELTRALSKLSRKQHDAVYVAADPFLLRERAKVRDAIYKARIPAIFPWREYHEGLALISYGPSMKETMSRVAVYVDKILRGANPAELPIDQISKYELVINMRVARDLGIEVPQELLLRADEVIR